VKVNPPPISHPHIQPSDSCPLPHHISAETHICPSLTSNAFSSSGQWHPFDTSPTSFPGHRKISFLQDTPTPNATRLSCYTGASPFKPSLRIQCHTAQVRCGELSNRTHECLVPFMGLSFSVLSVSSASISPSLSLLPILSLSFSLLLRLRTE